MCSFNLLCNTIKRGKYKIHQSITNYKNSKKNQQFKRELHEKIWKGRMVILTWTLVVCCPVILGRVCCAWNINFQVCKKYRYKYHRPLSLSWNTYLCTKVLSIPLTKGQQIVLRIKIGFLHTTWLSNY